MLTVNVHQHNC